MNFLNLKDKNILITGSSRGIGAGIAQELSNQGANIIMTYANSQESANIVLNQLNSQGQHLLVNLKINDSDSVNNCIKAVIEKYGSIDGLVNNAGITADQLLLRMKQDDFSKVLDTNLLGTFLCTKAVAKFMLKQKKGSIVNITSVIGQTGNAGQSNYAASKAGIEAFSKSLAQELASRNIRLNCVAPGFIATEMTEKLSDDQKSKIFEKIPLAKYGTVEDIAYSVAFLLSDRAKYITGHTLNVNGGLYM